MKTLLASILAGSLAFALPLGAAAGPDFITASPAPRELAASSGTRDIDPSTDVVFESDSIALSPASIAQVEAAARWLERHRSHRLVLEGYADSSGGTLYNEDLARRRAEIVRNHLVASGVPGDRVVLVVYGESQARSTAHPLDRRVVLFASTLPVARVVAAAFEDRDARTAMWTRGKARFTETRRPPTQISAR